MIKCLECENYVRNGKRHTCKRYPEITLYSEYFPNEPLKETCGAFIRIRHKTETHSKYRGGK